MNVRTMMGMSTGRLIAENSNSYHDKSVSVVNTPKSVRDAMFPMRVVPINQVGFRVKKVIIFAARLPLCPRSAICSLFAERYATSIPEKKIEKRREPIMPAKNALFILFSPSQIKKKKQDQREHNSPIPVSEADRHHLVNSDNTKAKGQ